VHPGEFLDQFAFYTIQTFAQVVEDDAINDLGLTIALRIVGSGESVSDLILIAKVGHLLAGIVCLVVGDNSMGSPKQHTMFCQKNLTIC